MKTIDEQALAKLIGWNINLLLLQNNKTQQELADYLGVGPMFRCLFLAYFRGFRRRLLENVLVATKKGPHF